MDNQTIIYLAYFSCLIYFLSIFTPKFQTTIYCLKIVKQLSIALKETFTAASRFMTFISYHFQQKQVSTPTRSKWKSNIYLPYMIIAHNPSSSYLSIYLSIYIYIYIYIYIMFCQKQPRNLFVLTSTFGAWHRRFAVELQDIDHLIHSDQVFHGRSYVLANAGTSGPDSHIGWRPWCYWRIRSRQ